MIYIDISQDETFTLETVAVGQDYYIVQGGRRISTYFFQLLFGPF